MRPPFGFVIRALAEAGLTLTELAERLGVTKQAAIKVVDEMEAHGFVERRPAPGDRRSKILGLTERGRDVRRAALAASHRIEDELRARPGRRRRRCRPAGAPAVRGAQAAASATCTPAAPARCGEVDHRKKAPGGNPHWEPSQSRVTDATAPRHGRPRAVVGG